MLNSDFQSKRRRHVGKETVDVFGAIERVAHPLTSAINDATNLASDVVGAH